MLFTEALMATKPLAQANMMDSVVYSCVILGTSTQELRLKYKALLSLNDLPQGWHKVEMVLQSGSCNEAFIASPVYAATTFSFTEASCVAVELAIGDCSVQPSTDGKSMLLE